MRNAPSTGLSPNTWLDAPLPEGASVDVPYVLSGPGSFFQEKGVPTSKQRCCKPASGRVSNLLALSVLAD